VTLAELNALATDTAARDLLRCCGSTAWASRMADARPFESADALFVTADCVWRALEEPDWREAFAAHPQIGASGASSASGAWPSAEQAGVVGASSSLIDRLAAKNREYEARFGYIFIVCATGKTAEEMLALLEQRLTNDSAVEIRIAADEQRRITRLRLQKLLAEASA
jgi:OHCU decarboxylase